MTILTAWHHNVQEIPRAGISERRVAGEELRKAIAEELTIPACRKLIVDYVIKNAGAGRFQLKGTLTAEFERECVLTLDSLTETLNEPLDCLFVPPELMPQHQSEEEEAHAVEEIEPIVQQNIEIGRIIYEVIVAALDPYPRAPDAALALPNDVSPNETREKPFAALKKLTEDRDAES